MLASVLLCALVVGSAKAELTGMDIGPTWPPNPAGTLSIIAPGSDYVVDAAGRDIWDNADSFHYAYEPVLVTGDFEAIVLVDSLAWSHDPCNVHGWAKAGIMARAELTEDSAHAMVCRTGHNGVHQQARQVKGGQSITKDLGSGDVFGSPIWVKLARKGNFFAAWWSQDVAGLPGTWQNPTVTYVEMPNSVFLGLATTSHDNTEPNNVVMAIYRAYSVGPLTDFPPLPNFGPFPGPEGGPGYIGIREVINNGNIDNQNDCYNSLHSGTGTIVDYNAPVLNITDSGPTGHFSPDDVFGVVTEGYRTKGTVEDLSMVVKGTIQIPTSGDYTFCVKSDDGFTLQFPGHDFNSVSGPGWQNVYPEIWPFPNGYAMRFWGGRGVADTFGVINLPAGDHPFVLTYHEGHTLAAVEFSAAPGARTTFDPNVFALVGGESVPAKPPVPDPPSIDYGAGWPVTMVYQPYTAGLNFSDELDSAIANVEAVWAGMLPGPNVGTATANWLNFEDPDRGGGGKGFPKEPFPGSNDGLNNDHFAMGAGTHTSPNRLFAIRDNVDGTYVIDISTGVPTLIGPSGVRYTTCGLTHSGGSVLYGSVQVPMSVIQTDGSGVTVMGNCPMEGMAYDIATGTLYGTYDAQFFTVDTATGNRLTTLPNWPMDVEGLAFVPSVGIQGSVYGMSYDGYLFRYDVARGRLYLVGITPLGIASDNSGLAYAPDLDVLFHITRNGGNLYSIDKNTAAPTFVANTGIYGFSGFSGLAYGPGPATSIATTITIYDEGDYTFLMYGDDSSQFRILDLAGGNPYAWTINDHEMPPGREIVRLPDGSGFRFHGCCLDAKGTIHLTPGDYNVQVMFNERGDRAYFGLWSSLNGSRLFLLGDTTPVPGAPEIHALELVGCPYMLLGDVNHDCKVNFLDIAIAAMNWLTDCTMTPGDPACIHK